MHYTESQTSVGDEAGRSGGEVDHHSDPLPEHSAVTAQLDYESLFSASKDWRQGGSRSWVSLFFFLVRRTLAFQYKHHQISGKENIERKRGDLCVAWHTNGIIDPALVLLHRGGQFVVGGRHDLVTRRSLRFWLSVSQFNQSSVRPNYCVVVALKKRLKHSIAAPFAAFQKVCPKVCLVPSFPKEQVTAQAIFFAFVQVPLALL